jgi:hypothetical protein
MSNSDHQYGPVTPALLAKESEITSNSNEYIEFESWWQEYAKTLNQRATLNWIEIAWAGWFARSEKSEGKVPTIFPRRKGE